MFIVVKILFVCIQSYNSGAQEKSNLVPDTDIKENVTASTADVDDDEDDEIDSEGDDAPNGDVNVKDNQSNSDVEEYECDAVSFLILQVLDLTILNSNSV